MPYTSAQCSKFAIMASEGKKVPSDWKKHCKKGAKKKTKKKAKKKRK